jgi:hypothetical protein
MPQGYVPACPDTNGLGKFVTHVGWSVDATADGVAAAKVVARRPTIAATIAIVLRSVR